MLTFIPHEGSQSLYSDKGVLVIEEFDEFVDTAVHCTRCLLPLCRNRQVVDDAGSLASDSGLHIAQQRLAKRDDIAAEPIHSVHLETPV